MQGRPLWVRAILYFSVPFVFILTMAVILTFRILRWAYKLAAYGISAVKVFLAVSGEIGRPGKEDFNETIEFTGFTYDPEQDIFISTLDAWQREFGYCRLYDEAAAPFGMIVDCEPIYFEYGGRYWLIEFWKGQYDLTTGCEIGVYVTDEPSTAIPGAFNWTHYDSGSNQDLLQISFSVKKNNKPYFSRYGRHWWLTGFKLGEFSEPSELTMKIYIALKNEDMRDAFVGGLKEAGYPDKAIKRYGDSVSFIFDRPKTRQPYTRTRFTDYVIQSKNRFMCLKFMELAGTGGNMQDKLDAIREKSPGIYRKAINLGMRKKTYKKLFKINSYLIKE